MSKKNKKNQNEEAKAAKMEEIQDNEALNEQQAEQQPAEENDLDKKIADLEAAVEHERLTIWNVPLMPSTRVEISTASRRE